MNRKHVEIWVGLFVAVGIGALALLAFRVGNLSESSVSNGYNVTAGFDEIGGLKVTAPVTLAGVRIGRVTDITIDSQSFRAVVQLTIDGKYNNLPRDTSASILTAGLLGDKYIGLGPGGSDENLKDGDRIETTTSGLILERLVGQLIFNKAAETETATDEKARK